MKSLDAASAALIKAAARLNPSELSHLGSKPNYLSEYFLFPKAYRRAGRARALAEAAGIEKDVDISYPKSMNWLYALAGGALGAGIGGVAGNAASLIEGDPEGHRILPGLAIGGTLGTALGSLAAAISRRRAANEVFEEVKGKPLDADKITKTPPAPHLLTAGLHIRGRADVAKKLRDGELSGKAKNPYMVASQVGTMVPGVSYLAAPAYMGGSVYHGWQGREDLKG